MRRNQILICLGLTDGGLTVVYNTACEKKVFEMTHQHLDIAYCKDEKLLHEIHAALERARNACFIQMNQIHRKVLFL